MANTTGEINLRAENIDKIVKDIANMEFVMKELCMVDSSSAWVETYYRETNTELTNANSPVKGVPRLANLPYAEASWTKLSSYIEKYGCEGVISYEDELLNNIPMIARTLLKISRAVAYAVDSQIFTALRDGAGNSVAIAVGYEWDNATTANQNPIKDLLYAKKEIYKDNKNPDNGSTYLVVNPTDYANLLQNTKIINSPTFKQADIISNGNVGKICNLTIKVSNAVSASGALVVIAKEGATWKQATPLTTKTIEDPGIKKTIRAFELGVCQVVSPNAICKITNTAVNV